MGVGEDLNLGDSVSVTIIATGFNADQQNEITNTEPEKIIHPLEDEEDNLFNQKPIENAIVKEEENEETEEKIIHVLDDIGQPTSCEGWGDAGSAGIPPIIDGT